MMKNFVLALLAMGVLAAAFACDAKDSKAQSQAIVVGNVAKPEDSTAPAQAVVVAEPKELTLDLGDNVTLKLLHIPAGKFIMGSPSDMTDREDDEGLPPDRWVDGRPQFEVTISKPFYMGMYEVTVDQYEQFVKNTGTKHREPWAFKQTGDHPVVDVSWADARAFCEWLSEKSGKTVVLPTEAQWEYACRAGSGTRFYFGDNDKELGYYAWYIRNSMGEEDRDLWSTHPVGLKRPNPWGLYDMHGNAWEWCADFYAEYTGARTDPTGPETGGPRVLRSGSWNTGPIKCHSARRYKRAAASGLHPEVGFRVVVMAATDEKLP